MIPSKLKLRLPLVAVTAASLLAATTARADESELILPDLDSVTFLGMPGRTLLMIGILVCLAGLAFGLFMYSKLKNLPVHRSMREVSELIYETCKTYLVTQGKFILLLEVFIGAIMVFYFGWLRHMEAYKVAVILIASSTTMSSMPIDMPAWSGIAYVR